MLFPSFTSEETADELRVTITPGGRIGTILSLAGYGAIYLGFIVFLFWFYRNDEEWTGLSFWCGALTVGYAVLFRALAREGLLREFIFADKNILRVTIKGPFGVRSTATYSRSGIFDFSYGGQHVKGSLFFTYDNAIARFGIMLHPEDSEELYKKMLVFFNRCGHTVTDDTVYEVTPEEF